MRNRQIFYLLAFSLFLVWYPATGEAADCNYLKFTLEIITHGEWNAPEMSCAHGSATLKSDYRGDQHKLMREYELEAGSMAGPECEFEIYNTKYPGSKNKYRIEQNWCVLEGGDISITRLSGPFDGEVSCKVKGTPDIYSIPFGCSDRKGYLYYRVYDTYND